MKTLFLLLLLPLLSSISLWARTDTVYVNITQTSTLVFDSDVHLVDVGLKQNYAVRVEQNVVLVKALKNASPETSLFVSTVDNKVFSGILKYGRNGKFFYDFRTRGTKGPHGSISPVDAEHDVALMKQRLDLLKKIPRRLTTVGVTSNGLSFSLLNLVADDNCLYLSLRLVNTTALIYKVSSIVLEKTEFSQKRRSAKKTNSVPVTPLLEGDTGNAKPYGHQDYYLAIPVMAVGKQGGLQISIRESAGARSLKLLIPYSLMAKANVF